MCYLKRTLSVLLMLVVGAASASDEKFLYDFQEQPRSIDEYTGNGKWLVLMIWAHDCHVCNNEAESYVHFHEEHKDRDARVLGLSLDGLVNKTKAEAFISDHDLPFVNLIGEPQNIMLYYQLMTGGSFLGTPSFMIFNPEGQLMAAQAGAVPPALIEKFIVSKSQ